MELNDNEFKKELAKEEKRQKILMGIFVPLLISSLTLLVVIVVNL